MPFLEDNLTVSTLKLKKHISFRSTQVYKEEFTKIFIALYKSHPQWTNSQINYGTSLIGIVHRMSEEQGRFIGHCKTLPISWLV